MNDYEILGLSPHCTKEDLERQRKFLVKILHPDVYKTIDPNKKLAEINAAFDRLIKIVPDKKNTSTSGSWSDSFRRNAEDGLNSPPCPKCGLPMVLRESAYGKFFGCCQFPDCNGKRRYYGA